MDDELLIYGAYGYTGSLIARRAVEEGLSPVVAGRRAEPLEAQATELGVEHRVFSLEHPSVVASEVESFDAVLNCAGPFAATARPLVDACLETDADYLDIAGRIQVLEETAQRDSEAVEADVTVLPAVGFDAVPTDCLAGVLAEDVADPEQLTMAMDGLGTFSPGTVKSIAESLDQPGAVREHGEIRSVPVAWKTRTFDFGRGEKEGVTIPWGSVSTVYYSTGIDNIETYATVPPRALAAMQRARPLTPILSSSLLRRGLSWAADRFVSGPTADERARNTNRIWGEVHGANGERAVGRLTTPDTYELTAATAVESARRVVDGDVGSGFQTPVTAFDVDYVQAFDGVELEREPAELASAVDDGPSGQPSEL